MSERHLSGRQPRRSDGVASASAHPELVSGDLAIPPPISITSMNRPIASDAARRAFGTLAVVAIAGLLSFVMVSNGASPDDASVEKRKFARACLQWHLAAGNVVARLVQGTRDSDLLQANDSIFRMRRARRNCEAGWFTLACQDYHAVATGVPGHVMASRTFPCSRLADLSQDHD